MYHAKMIIKEEHEREIGNFIDSTEWWKQNMNLEMLREDERLDAEIADMKKTVKRARKWGISDNEVLNGLLQDYGNDFTKERIERLVKTGK